MLFHHDWDHHSRLPSWCRARCLDTDQASAALITDLKRRGLLDDTLVIWGGECGRGVAGKVGGTAPMQAAITTRAVSPCWWPAAVSNAA